MSSLSRYIGDVRQSVKFAASDLKDDVTELPGFCLPKKVRLPLTHAISLSVCLSGALSLQTRADRDVSLLTVMTALCCATMLTDSIEPDQ